MLISFTYCLQIVRYRCDYGYKVDGRSWQVCRGNGGPIGTWTDHVPGCRGKDNTGRRILIGGAKVVCAHPAPRVLLLSRAIWPLFSSILIQNEIFFKHTFALNLGVRAPVAPPLDPPLGLKCSFKIQEYLIRHSFMS